MEPILESRLTRENIGDFSQNVKKPLDKLLSEIYLVSQTGEVSYDQRVFEVKSVTEILQQNKGELVSTFVIRLEETLGYI